MHENKVIRRLHEVISYGCNPLKCDCCKNKNYQITTLIDDINLELDRMVNELWATNKIREVTK